MARRSSKSAKNREKQAYFRTARIRKQADNDYDEHGYYDEYDDDAASKWAGLGCLIAFLVVVAIVVVIGLVVWSNLKKEIDGKNATATEAVAIDIESGYGGRTIGNLLEENGLIANADIFRFYVKFISEDENFQMGRFYLEPGMSYDEMIVAMSQSPAPRDTVRVTIPEGSTVYQFGRIMEEAGLCTVEEFIEEANNIDAFSDIQFFQYIDFDENTYMKAEGYLAPNTYDFYVDETVHNIVRKLYEQFNSQLTSEMYARMEEQGLSLRDAVTLASLVEEEAGLPENQPPVAGVFWNRLHDEQQEGMEDIPRTMGSDVTYYYLRDWVSRSYNDNLDDIPDEIFYAYYTADDDPKSRQGLPAGPISCPSLTALEAALWPEENDYYYFLTDYYGNYYYAQTYNQHLANIETMNYQNAQYEAEKGEAPEEGDAAEAA